MLKKGKRLLALALAVLLWVNPALTVSADDLDPDDPALAISAANFPDANFRSWLVSEFDYDGDGYLSFRDLEATQLNVGGLSIASLQGIEFFGNLTYLDCHDNQLTSLDVSKNTALTYLSCHSNQLTSLDVSKNTALTDLSCGSNQLTSLNVSNCTALTDLSCGYNQLTSLDVSNCTALTDLYCNDNLLTSLDVSKNTALTNLSCGSTQLASLDVSKNTALTYLNCCNNQLTSLDVSKNTALTELFCDANDLTSLDVSNCTALTSFSCSGNSYEIKINRDGTFDLATLPGNFDVSKASNWTNASVEEGILTVADISLPVTYTYDCGMGYSAYFELNITGSAVPIYTDKDCTLPITEFTNSFGSISFDTNRPDDYGGPYWNSFFVKVTVSDSSETNPGEKCTLTLPEGFSFEEWSIVRTKELPVEEVTSESGAVVEVFPQYVPMESNTSQYADFTLSGFVEDSFSVPMVKNEDEGLILCRRTAKVNAESEDIPLEIRVSMDDPVAELIGNSVSSYSDNLALIECALTQAIYGSPTGDTQEIKDSLHNLGFSQVAYYESSGDHGVACAIAQKKLIQNGEVRNALMIVIRGTVGDEWIGDFFVDTLKDNYPGTDIGDYHSDFYNAAEEVQEHISEYLNEANVTTDRTRAHVCGHSRGAAVANIICKRINDKNGLSFKDMTSYTFATPNSMRVPEAQRTANNVFNIVDAADLVAFVPQLYFKYGITYVQGMNTTEYPAKVQQLLDSYTGKKHTRPNSDLMQSIAYRMGEAGNAGISNRVVAWFIGKGAQMPALWSTDIAKAHCGENYLAWVQAGISKDTSYSKALSNLAEIEDREGAKVTSLSAMALSFTSNVKATLDFSVPMASIFTPFKSGFNILAVSCPVDVEIRDSNGTIVASYEDHTLITEGENVFAWSEEESDCIIFPSDMDYTVTITGTGEGTMHIGSVKTNSDLEDLGSVNLSDIPVTDGVVYQIDIDANSQPEDWELDTGNSLKLVDLKNSENRIFMGDSVTFTPVFTGEGEIASMMYQIWPVVETDDGYTWGDTLLEQSDKIADSYTFTPKEPGEYACYFEVTTDTGETFTMASYVVQVLADGKRIENFTASADTIYVGESVTFTAEFTGQGEFTDMIYSIWPMEYVDGKWEATSDEPLEYSTEMTSSYTFTPTKPGYYAGQLEVYNDMDQYWYWYIVIEVLDGERPNLTRVFGNDRYLTAYAVADQLKQVMGVDKFSTIIVADGQNFPDALSGSYLSTEKDAPILLTGPGQDTKVLEYIQDNLVSGGRVYILGGANSVSEGLEDGLKNAQISVTRLSGNDRYLTNLAILREAGLNGTKIIVSDAGNYADSLSASAANLPILLVNNKSKKLTADQVTWLESLSGSLTFCIVGGENSVDPAFATALEAYGTVERIAGSGREATSAEVARAFFGSPDNVVLAYSWNFPDGLCGGLLAYKVGAPLLLVNSGAEAAAADYVEEKGIQSGYILGGTNSVTESSVSIIFK